MKKTVLFSTPAPCVPPLLATLFLLSVALPLAVPFIGGDAARCEEAENAGTTVFSFLRVGQGTRAAAMGGAYVAVAEDASCLDRSVAST